MQPEGLEDRTRRVVADVLGLPFDQVTLTTSNSTVKNWDSVNMVNLLMAVESEFSVELSIDDAARLLSVSDILEVLRSRGLT